jgi:hypothetical protein
MTYLKCEDNYNGGGEFLTINDQADRYPVSLLHSSCNLVIVIVSDYITLLMLLSAN